MKKLVFLLSVISSLIKAQEAKIKYYELPLNSENKVCYTGVVDLPEKTKQEIYKSMKDYLLLNYVNKGYKILEESTDERIYINLAIIAPVRRYYFPLYWGTKEYTLRFLAKFEFKDGKYRYELTDMTMNQYTNAKAVSNGYGITTFIDSKTTTKPLEKFYTKKYRKKFNKLVPSIDGNFKFILAQLEKSIKQTKKDW